MDILRARRLGDLDEIDNDGMSTVAGRFAHEAKTWVAAFAALSVFGPYEMGTPYYRDIPEWIAGYGVLDARPLLM